MNTYPARVAGLLIALAAVGTAAAQAPAANTPVAPPGSKLAKEVKDATAGNAPNDAARRQAESPYRFILINAKPQGHPKKAEAAKEAPRTQRKPLATATKPASGSEQTPHDSAPSAVGTASGTPAAPPVAADTPPPAAAAASAAASAAPGVAATAASLPAAASSAADGAAASSGTDAVAASPTPMTPPVQTLDVEAAAAAAPPPADEAPIELVPLVRDPPVLSPAVQREARKGTVRVQFTVMPDGSVTGAKAVSTTEIAFNRPVVAAVSKWRFKPIRTEQEVQVQIDIDLDRDSGR